MCETGTGVTHEAAATLASSSSEDGLRACRDETFGGMSWSRRFRIRQYLKNSIWLVPFVGGIVGAVCGMLEPRLDDAVSVPQAWQYSASTASTVLSAIIGAMAALTGFVVTVTVLVVQMAIGTFSARYMRLWYRDRVLKGLLATLVATLTFSFALLREVKPSSVPTIGVTVAGLLVLAGLLYFMVFLDRFLHRLRPVAVAALVGRAGRRAFEDGARVVEVGGDDVPTRAVDPSLLVRTPRAGVIQAVDERGLVRWSQDHDCVLYLRHAIGDFIPAGAVLAEVQGRLRDPDADERALCGLFALGDERTIEQDPAFALRIMVDIAIKALSAAINDPTTATQVLNHLTELLRLIGATPLDVDIRLMRDETGTVRIVGRARRWEDYLALACTEIREYGAGAIQVQRRLRAMLEELRETVRLEHRDAVDAELERLNATVESQFGDSVDFDRAGVADDQGIGGPPSALRLGTRALGS
jgi:uncharacterized membrane protein